MFKRAFSTVIRELPQLNNLSRHNLNHVTRFNFTINNVDHSSNAISRNYMLKYSSTIYFEKNGLAIQRSFDSNDFNKLMNDINDFIESEIKL